MSQDDPPDEIEKFDEIVDWIEDNPEKVREFVDRIEDVVYQPGEPGGRGGGARVLPPEQPERSYYNEQHTVGLNGQNWFEVIVRLIQSRRQSDPAPSGMSPGSDSVDQAEAIFKQLLQEPDDEDV